MLLLLQRLVDEVEVELNGALIAEVVVVEVSPLLDIINGYRIPRESRTWAR